MSTEEVSDEYKRIMDHAKQCHLGYIGHDRPYFPITDKSVWLPLNNSNCLSQEITVKIKPTLNNSNDTTSSNASNL